VATAADTQLLKNWISFEPSTTIEDGVCIFLKWYKDFYFKNFDNL